MGVSGDKGRLRRLPRIESGIASIEEGDNSAFHSPDPSFGGHMGGLGVGG